MLCDRGAEMGGGALWGLMTLPLSVHSTSWKVTESVNRLSTVNRMKTAKNIKIWFTQQVISDNKFPLMKYTINIRRGHLFVSLYFRQTIEMTYKKHKKIVYKSTRCRTFSAAGQTGVRLLRYNTQQAVNRTIIRRAEVAILTPFWIEDFNAQGGVGVGVRFSLIYYPMKRMG